MHPSLLPFYSIPSQVNIPLRLYQAGLQSRRPRHGMHIKASMTAPRWIIFDGQRRLERFSCWVVRLSLSRLHLRQIQFVLKSDKLSTLRLVLARCLDAVAIRSIVYICVLMMFSGKRSLFLDDNATRDPFLSLHIGSGLLRRHYGCLMVQ